MAENLTQWCAPSFSTYGQALGCRMTEWLYVDRQSNPNADDRSKWPTTGRIAFLDRVVTFTTVAAAAGGVAGQAIQQVNIGGGKNIIVFSRQATVINTTAPVVGATYAVLPILLAVFVGLAPQTRLYRTFFLDEINQDYVRTARAKGLGETTVVLKHAFRNALTPIITLGALELGTLLSGAVLTEQVFSIPGFGKLIVDAVFNRDYAVVQGVVLITATTYITLNLLADLAAFVVNPRLRP